MKPNGKGKRNTPDWMTQTTAPIIIIGLSWYNEEEWATVKASAVDPELFEDSYAEWLQMAENALSGMQETGLMAEKYYIKSDELLTWCRSQNKVNNSSVRADFVSAQLQNSDQSSL
jgi:hypothetical protein